MENLSTIETAANSIVKKSANKPSPDSVILALIEIEKQSKKEKQTYQLQQLSGNWQLCFVTGTKKTREKAGIVLGAGRYIPNWVKITLSYSAPINTSEIPQQIETGTVENTVEFAGLKLSLSGPTKFIDKKNILAFDFTKITVKLFGGKLYSGYIRGGKESENKFATESVGKQAFFAYFLIQEKFIAARGRGGGLAIWGKLEN
ncbi:MAG: hypothetical protein F6K40_06360 [Okeania sp. SIO3I5]|uniref:hypothetical protein n=1 Tax=Okeania sp. SIO3I5 TaxID=2607805 RepID=UPI0013B82608|nr:hypothetical protein [Okeania sp. SIO3I5]NEQ35928.1 hypothetical protein [Okeania sp. SIO3I5]